MGQYSCHTGALQQSRQPRSKMVKCAGHSHLNRCPDLSLLKYLRNKLRPAAVVRTWKSWGTTAEQEWSTDAGASHHAQRLPRPAELSVYPAIIERLTQRVDHRRLGLVRAVARDNLRVRFTLPHILRREATLYTSFCNLYRISV